MLLLLDAVMYMASHILLANAWLKTEAMRLTRGAAKQPNETASDAVETRSRKAATKMQLLGTIIRTCGLALLE